MVRNRIVNFSMDIESTTEVLREDVSLAEVQELVRRGEVDVKEQIATGTTFFTKFAVLTWKSQIL